MPPPSPVPSSPPPPPPLPPKLKVHTCDKKNAKSDKAIYYVVDGGKDLIELDHKNHNDRERDQYDTYDELPYAASEFAILTKSNDGWCVDKLEYADTAIDLTCPNAGTGFWLDKPCDVTEADLPCTNKIVVDVKSGEVRQKHEATGTLMPLCLPQLVTHTCDIKGANSDDDIQYSVDGSSEGMNLDNVNVDDRERNNYDTYYNLMPATSSYTLGAKGSDGWCVDQIEYKRPDGTKVTADLVCPANPVSGVWLDKPCDGGDYKGVPCTKKVEIDVKTGEVLQKHEPSGAMLPLCLPQLKVHTCDVRYGSSNDAIIYSVDGADAMMKLDTLRHNDRERNQVDLYFNLMPATSSFTLQAKGGDGWCVDSIEYIRADKSKVTADLCNGKGVWLDKPCSKKDYDDVKCGEEIVVDVKTGSVTVKNKKDGNTLKSLC
jgi:hypothetical protein